jgi:hypothetical protein
MGVRDANRVGAQDSWYLAMSIRIHSTLYRIPTWYAAWSFQLKNGSIKQNLIFDDS